MRKPLILPGWGSQTPAVQALIGPRRKTRTRRKTTRRKKAAAPRRRAAKTTTRRRRGTTSRRKKPAYMVKGSPAARRHMAKLRKMRRR